MRLSELKYRQMGDFGGYVKQPKNWVLTMEALIGGLLIVSGAYLLIVFLNCLQ